jgi:DNA-binding transcriptional ArsR family regulator
VLRSAGLLRERRDGNYRYYRADRAALGPLEAVLHQMWTSDLDQLRQLAEQEAQGGSQA